MCGIVSFCHVILRTKHHAIKSQIARQFQLGVSDIFFIQYVTDTSHGLQVLYLSPFL